MTTADIMHLFTAAREEGPRCPQCGSVEVSLPSASDPYYTCADCGHSWPVPGMEPLCPQPEEDGMTFFLGTDRTTWPRRTDVPLFLSRRWLAPMRKLPRALGPWALDSGAFTELSLHGHYRTAPTTYSSEARRLRDEVGKLQWAAIQDWPCEPPMRAKTGFSVREHQRRTVHSYLLLRDLAPDLPWVPVLQGWRLSEYFDHAEEYGRAGVDLATLPLVGLGSVCRRQRTAGVCQLVRDLHGMGIRLHAFGLKLGGVRRCAPYLASSDSMAWSYEARRRPPLPGCGHRRCNHCLVYALRWREKVLRAVSGAQASQQALLF